MTDDRNLHVTISAEQLGQLGGDVAKFLTGIWVRGVEVTQGIQWYSAAEHLTDPADRGPDNGITLVANKPAWIRVYVGGFTAHAGVSATVSLQRHDGLGLWVDRATPVRQGASSINYDPTTSYATRRRNLAETLNFVIPADQMHGSMRLVVTIASIDGAGDSSTVDLDATLLQTLQVRGIPIRYWGADASGNQVQLGPTTSADFVSTATWPMLTYPVENVPSVSLAGIFTWSESLAGAAATAGGCSTGWNDLLFWLHVAKVLDGNQAGVIYYGLLPAGTPDGPVIGCDANGASAGLIADGVTMAHEMGHYQGFPHAPCGNVGTPDPNYPAYEPYDSVSAKTASIGEFGLDVSTGAIFDPASAKDYMSYCAPQWTSLYHYRSQIGSSWFNPRYVASDDRPPWWDHYVHYRPYDVRRDLPRPGPIEEFFVHDPVERELVAAFVVTGMLAGDGLEVRSVLAIDAVVGGGQVGEERLELLGRDGAVIGRAGLAHLVSSACCRDGGCGGSAGGCGCGGCGGADSCSDCPRIVQAVVPHDGAAASMRIVRGDVVLWQQDAPERPPAVGTVTARVDDGRLSVSWQEAGGNHRETHLRRSSDGGRTWNLLELRPRGTETAIPLEVLPPGRHLVQVVVSDGFHSAVSEPVEFEVPHRAPSARIHWPLEGAGVALSATLRLWGTGLSAVDRTLPDEAHTWTIDDRPAGVGRDIWVEPPQAEGEHEAVLTVRDEHGTTRVASQFWVTRSGQAPRLLGRHR